MASWAPLSRVVSKRLFKRNLKCENCFTGAALCLFVCLYNDNDLDSLAGLVSEYVRDLSWPPIEGFLAQIEPTNGLLKRTGS